MRVCGPFSPNLLLVHSTGLKNSQELTDLFIPETKSERFFSSHCASLWQSSMVLVDEHTRQGVISHNETWWSSPNSQLGVFLGVPSHRNGFSLFFLLPLLNYLPGSAPVMMLLHTTVSFSGIRPYTCFTCLQILPPGPRAPANTIFR